MIEIVELLRINIPKLIISTYNPAVKTFNILTEFMNDACKPYQIGKNLCIWLDKDGILGELDCVFPRLISHEKCSLDSIKQRSKGVPLFKLLSANSDIYVQQISSGFIVWIAENKEVTHEIQMGSIKFFLSGRELVGILSEDMKLTTQ